MLKGIREEQAEGCVKDWAEKDALEEEYCTDFYEAWHRDEYSEKHFTASIEKLSLATVYKGNIIKNLIMDCQSYTKYRPNETTGGIFVSWRRKEELPTGA